MRNRVMALPYEVVKVTEMRDGCVFKTKVIRKVWVSCYCKDHAEVAKRFGGDMLAAISAGDPLSGEVKWISGHENAVVV